MTFNHYSTKNGFQWSKSRVSYDLKKKSNQFSELQPRQALLMAESSLGNDDEAALHRGTMLGSRWGLV